MDREFKSTLINIFEVEKTCEYRGDIYRVRDNGSIYRERNSEKRKRQLDEQWTFGNMNKRSGYLSLSSEVVHRIVATAFHGNQPDKYHIVDHIDTNRQNNRPENLRWITRLENLLHNPLTLTKILWKYGNLDYFFSNPSEPIKGGLDQNFEWMRTVTKAEGKNSLDNLLKLAGAGGLSNNGALGEWVFRKLEASKVKTEKQDTLVQSSTASAIQKNWKIISEFPNCPAATNENALSKYYNQLNEGSIFSNNKYGQSVVLKSAIAKSTNELIVLTTSKYVKPYFVAKVYIESDSFIHESIQSCFKVNGAEKLYNQLIDIPWEGEDSIDDFC